MPSRLILFAKLALISYLSHSQDQNIEYDTTFYVGSQGDEKLVYARNARFDDSNEGWEVYLRRKLKYPKAAKRINISGTVIIQFVVEKDGSLSNLKVIKDIGFGCAQEAMRVLLYCPQWIPGSITPDLKNWINVRQQMKQVFHFK